MVAYDQPEVSTFICHRWNAVRYQILDPLKIKYRISDQKKIKYQISDPQKNQISDIMRSQNKSNIWLKKSDIRYQTQKKTIIRYHAP